MTNYKKYLEEKDLQKSSYPPDYPEKFQNWLDEMRRSGYTILEVKEIESPHRRYIRGYVTPDSSTLIICECIEHKKSGAVEKFAEVWAPALTLRRMTAMMMKEAMEK